MAIQKFTPFALVAAMTLGACSSPMWPAERGGGMAEHAPNLLVSLDGEWISLSHRALFDQVLIMEERIESLIHDGAKRYAAAETTLALKLTARIRREIAGDLLAEAEKDLISLRERIERIHNRVYWMDAQQMNESA